MEKNIEDLSAYLKATQWEFTVIYGAWVRDVQGSSLDSSFEGFISLSLQAYMSNRRRQHPSDNPQMCLQNSNRQKFLPLHFPFRELLFSYHNGKKTSHD